MPYDNLIIGPPWLGINTEVADVHTPPGAFKDALNFFMVRGRIQTRPRLITYKNAPDGNKIYFMRTFKDVNETLHTLALTTENAYYLTELGGLPVFNLLTFPAGITTLGSVDRPFGVASILSRIYFSNGGAKVLFADGSSTLKLAGNVPGGARFLAVVGSILILGYLHENSRTYSSAVRWSVIGNPNSYTGFTSGSNVLIEVPDDITGMIGTSRSGFIFRTNGITMLTPTSQGIAPLAFEHFATQPEGVGNRYPYSLASYGSRAFFVADDDIYSLDFPSFSPIGGGARRRIFQDIALANAPIIGQVIPGLGIGYDFLSYWLTIPKVSDTVSWVFSVNEGMWTRFEGDGALTSIAQVFIN